MRRVSPRACPSCGSCDVVAAKAGEPWQCNHCGHRRRKPFPTVAGLGSDASAPKSHYTTGPGSRRVIAPQYNYRGG